MKKLHEIRLLIYSIGLLLSSIIERAITNFAAERINLFGANTFFYHFFSTVILIFLFFFTNFLLKKFINTKMVSKKFFRNQYVGGHWVEIVYQENCDGTYEVSRYCDLNIGYDIDKIYLSGTDYDKKFDFLYNLETESASMENYSLSYIFRCVDGEKSWQGLGNIAFHKKALSSPDRYTGRFKYDDVLTGECKKFRAEGFLINDKSDIKRLNEDFVSTFKELIPELTKRCNFCNEASSRLENNTEKNSFKGEENE